MWTPEVSLINSHLYSNQTGPPAPHHQSPAAGLGVGLTLEGAGS